MDTQPGLCEGVGMPVKAVVFDLDDTLIVDEAVSKEAMQAVAQALSTRGVDARMFLQDAEQMARRFWAECPALGYCEGIGISFEECLYGDFQDASGTRTGLAAWTKNMGPKFFEAVLARHTSSDAFLSQNLAEQYRSERHARQRLMPGAMEVLAELRKHHSLGLLTNGNPRVQRQKITHFGFESMFDQIIVSGEEGIGKPSPDIFLTTAQRLGVLPSECVMVGNSLKRDIAGAAAAGYGLTVWLVVPGSEEHASVSPDRTIHALGELPPLLR